MGGAGQDQLRLGHRARQRGQVRSPAKLQANKPRHSAGMELLALAIAAFLLTFLLLPVATVVVTVYVSAGRLYPGAFQCLRRNFADARVFRQQPLCGRHDRVFATLLALPLAAITAHFELRSPLLIQTLVVLRPCSCCLGARAGQPAAQQRLWGLTAADGGINGVIFIETLHCIIFHSSC